MNDGTVGILNVGAGDTKLSFDPTNPAERIRAARIVKDMIRRGYALLVQTGEDTDGKPTYTRALDFDEEHAEYIIADLDPVKALEEDLKEEENAGDIERKPATGKPRGRKGAGRKRVAADKTKAVAVSRTAGG